MIRSNKKSTKVLSGVFCLPTSSKAHPLEPTRGSAFKAAQYMYILNATQGVDEGGYPPSVCLTSDEPIDGFELNGEVATQHAEVRKNLPPRFVAGIVNPDGSTEGELPAKGLGLPHWAFINTNEDGSASMADIHDVKELIESNKAAAESAKEATRAAKASSKKSATTVPAPESN
jgi:hypothetical protein